MNVDCRLSIYIYIFIDKHAFNMHTTCKIFMHIKYFKVVKVGVEAIDCGRGLGEGSRRAAKEEAQDRRMAPPCGIAGAGNTPRAA